MADFIHFDRARAKAYFAEFIKEMETCLDRLRRRAESSGGTECRRARCESCVANWALNPARPVEAPTLAETFERWRAATA